MRFLIFAVLFAVAAAAPQFQQQAKPVFRILSDERNIEPSGRYFYSYETENGIKAEEQGDFVQARQQEAEGSAVVKGSYQFVAPDGQQYTVQYTADENGFHPEGAHLPVAPVAIPEAFQQRLQ
ncbi:larval cuticle protein 65Ag1-like [Frankliniella occidentalis]|uniref:Larval cuticle protein 65Ag1-like n=1 Tax=Frankliniella occidentalis TaxID=133901 RepID=A0A6J1S3A6_FRAOC|nr:larval cuticle protein 65Ag1-like [Frankliniella occidentalis]